MTFKNWLSELRLLFIAYKLKMSSGYRVYYDRGYSPSDVVDEIVDHNEWVKKVSN